jgi:hypothetical protein
MADLLSLSDPNPPIKMICMADSGGGKTGALASLASAGYRLRILDTDAGTDILRNLLLHPNTPYTAPKGGYDISVMKITEKMKNSGGKMIPASAKAWDQCMGKLEKWKDETQDHGSLPDWKDDTILVIDTLSSLSTFAMNKVLALNNRFGQQPFQSDWGEAQRLVEALLQTIYSFEIKCNVIMNCHITYIGPRDDEGKPTGIDKGYPNTLGKALSPKVGRYFNHALLIESGKIHTRTKSFVELKTSSPLNVKPSYPLDFGLADYFKDVRKGHPKRLEGPGTPGNP